MIRIFNLLKDQTPVLINIDHIVLVQPHYSLSDGKITGSYVRFSTGKGVLVQDTLYDILQETRRS